MRALSFDRDGRRSAFWPADGVPLTLAAGDQLLPRHRSGGPPGASVIIDAADGALVAWNDGRKGTDVDIYYQQVTRYGIVAPEDPPCSFECPHVNYVRSVYPNPTRGALSAKVWVPGFNSEVRLDLVDTRGRRVRSVTRSGFPPQGYANIGIDLTGLPSGLYFINYLREGFGPGGWSTLGHRQVVLVR
jgi:hypothetical protein